MLEKITFMRNGRRRIVSRPPLLVPLDELPTNVDLLAQGAGIALPIAALGLFIGLRAWALRQDRESHYLRDKSNKVDGPAVESQNLTVEGG
jgi:hypothetical protein